MATHVLHLNDDLLRTVATVPLASYGLGDCVRPGWRSVKAFAATCKRWKAVVDSIGADVYERVCKQVWWFSQAPPAALSLKPMCHSGKFQPEIKRLRPTNDLFNEPVLEKYTTGWEPYGLDVQGDTRLSWKQAFRLAYSVMELPRQTLLRTETAPLNCRFYGDRRAPPRGYEELPTLDCRLRTDISDNKQWAHRTSLVRRMLFAVRQFGWDGAPALLVSLLGDAVFLRETRATHLGRALDEQEALRLLTMLAGIVPEAAWWMFAQARCLRETPSMGDFQHASPGVTLEMRYVATNILQCVFNHNFYDELRRRLPFCYDTILDTPLLECAVAEQDQELFDLIESYLTPGYAVGVYLTAHHAECYEHSIWGKYGNEPASLLSVAVYHKQTAMLEALCRRTGNHGVRGWALHDEAFVMAVRSGCVASTTVLATVDGYNPFEDGREALLKEYHGEDRPEHRSMLHLAAVSGRSEMVEWLATHTDPDRWSRKSVYEQGELTNNVVDCVAKFCRGSTFRWLFTSPSVKGAKKFRKTTVRPWLYVRALQHRNFDLFNALIESGIQIDDLNTTVWEGNGYSGSQRCNVYEAARESFGRGAAERLYGQLVPWGKSAS